MKKIFIGLLLPITALAAPDTYLCTTDTNKPVELKYEGSKLVSLEIDGRDYTSTAVVKHMRGSDGVVASVRNFRGDESLYLGFGKQIYHIGNGKERQMNCVFKSGKPAAPPVDDGI